MTYPELDAAKCAPAEAMNTCESDADAARRFAGQCIDMQARIDKALKIIEEAGPALSIPPADCTDRCGDGPCDCSGLFRFVGWSLDPEAVRAALLGEGASPQASPPPPSGEAPAKLNGDAVLPTTREQLAEFFGGIRLASGAGVTGHFVQHALDLIDAHEQQIPCHCRAGITHTCGRLGIEGVD